jgi:hypothetical protein
VNDLELTDECGDALTLRPTFIARKSRRNPEFCVHEWCKGSQCRRSNTLDESNRNPQPAMCISRRRPHSQTAWVFMTWFLPGQAGAGQRGALWRNAFGIRRPRLAPRLRSHRRPVAVPIGASNLGSHAGPICKKNPPQLHKTGERNSLRALEIHARSKR